MTNLKVNLGKRSYPIYITSDYKGIGKVLDKLNAKKLVIITDDNVDKFQSELFINSIINSGYDVDKFVIRAGEESKNLDTVRDIYEYLVEMKCNRDMLLIALGGGVVGDITGFVAATFLRGVKFIQVPTTLLAQADSSVGGKTGVDFKGAKNIIGAFYQPKLVYINVNSLNTLPKREFISGLAEVIKHGIIYDKDFFEYLDSNVARIIEGREDVLQYIAKVNCSIKASVVEKDEKEEDLRAILNFGHTVGHAIESTLGFKLLHGECVALGFISACKIAEKMNMINQEFTKKIENILEKVGLPIKIDKIDVEAIYNQLFYDKKMKNKQLTFILPKKLGEVIKINIDDEVLIKESIKYLIRE